MKVTFTRTGGVAGMRLAAALDSEALSPQEAKRLRKLIDAASFFEQPEAFKSPAPAVDRFQYSVVVEEGERRKKIDLDESAVPEALRPLLDFLMERVRSGSEGKRR